MPKIRKKRFVLDPEDRLKGLWSANKGQLLRLSYNYASSISEDSAYKEFIEVAVENFNQLGLARLQYQPIAMGSYLKVCPLDAEYIKSKYKNPVTFSQFEAIDSNDTRICIAKNNEFFYGSGFGAEIRNKMAGDTIALPPFAEISCNPAHRLFQRMGIGVLLHEINHWFGIKHSHMSEETNGILTVNITKPELNDIKRGEFNKYSNIYMYEEFLQIVNYTLISPFSIQHYSAAALEPYQTFNKTRIGELLESYQISAEVKADYFYLLGKYAGYPILYTYQDIAALASAIYHIAPDSLVGNNFAFAYYYLVQGAYIPEVDKTKLVRLVNALSDAERFSYPILAQANATLAMEKSSFFVIDLVRKLKIVSLSNNLTCSLQEDNVTSLHEVYENLTLLPTCLLIGRIELSGSFEIPILLSDRLISTVRPILLAVKGEITERKNRVLLGRKEMICYKAGEGYVDLREICQAVALPPGKVLNCNFASSSSVVETVRLENCWLQFQEEAANQNLTFILSNEEANKTCHVQFFFNKTLALNEGYYAVDNPDYLASLSKNCIASDAIQAYRSPHLATQLSYCLVIPLFHGMLDGGIDSMTAHAYVKSGLKLLPRVGLWYFDYLSPMNFILLGGVSVLEGTIKNKLCNKMNGYAEKFIHFFLFLGIAELEYGFSNLWELTDQLRFWPALTDTFNQLFLQLLFTPLIKTLGYELSATLIQLISYILADPQKEVCVKAELPLLSNNDSSIKGPLPAKSTSFFSALRVASQSVFSSKITKVFSFFSRTDLKSSNEVFKKEDQPAGLLAQA